MTMEKKKENPLWLNDELQFARLIAEAEAEGVWTKKTVKGLCNQTGLELDEVYALIDRAQHRWDGAKERLLRRQKEGRK